MKIEIGGDFHDFCSGCTEIDLFQERYVYGQGPCVAKTSCRNYALCARLWDRLSTIRNDTPDLMEQIAAICREKCISVEEAVELFKRL